MCRGRTSGTLSGTLTDPFACASAPFDVELHQQVCSSSGIACTRLTCALPFGSPAVSEDTSPFGPRKWDFSGFSDLLYLSTRANAISACTFWPCRRTFRSVHPNLAIRCSSRPQVTYEQTSMVLSAQWATISINQRFTCPDRKTCLVSTRYEIDGVRQIMPNAGSKEADVIGRESDTYG
jgi:hypothetical protein